MKKKETSSGSGKFGMLGVLQLIFLVLKLSGLVDWSWWRVMSPMIVWASLMAICLLILGICAFIEKETEE